MLENTIMAHSAYTDVRVITGTITVTNGVSATLLFKNFTNVLSTGKPISPSQGGVCWCRNITPPSGSGSFIGNVNNAGGKPHDYIFGSVNGSLQEFSDQMVWQDEISYTIVGPNGSYTVDLWLI